jgi:hypothetical protein
MHIKDLQRGFDKAIEGISTLMKLTYKEEKPLSNTRSLELNAMRIGAVLALGLIRDHSYLSPALQKKLPSNEEMGDALLLSKLILEVASERNK